ncbi:MAG: hypothetical protein KBG29_01570 [Pseudomonadales bacterium]|nr:hypothetical protein [Pseudomonadales bacterium]
MTLQQIITRLQSASERADACKIDAMPADMAYVEAYAMLAMQVEFAVIDLTALLAEMIADGSAYACHE